jgi:hypothetical protein
VSAPSNLTAQVFDSPWRVELNWIDNSDNELGFIIARDDTISSGFVDYDTVNANITTYTDTNVEAIYIYVYKVYAFTANTVSNYSNTTQVLVPVELKSFTAYLSGNSVTILWTTVTELNNRGFDIERKIDKDWDKIAFVDGRGTTTEASNYKFVDDFKYISVKGIVKYRLKQIDFDGTYEYSDVVEVNVDFTPKEYTLYQNYPNPFNPTTTIKYQIPELSFVIIKVYDVLGNEVVTLVNEEKHTGIYEVEFDGIGKPSGIYFYRLVAGSFLATMKMVVVK